MKIKSILVFWIAFMLFSCKTDEQLLGNIGDIYVTVYTNSSYSIVPVKGANVFTVPATKQGITDEFGTTLLRNLDPGTYEVYASLNDFGSGKTVLRLTSDSLKKINIQIIQGVKTGFTPEIELILPGFPANFSTNEKIIFSFNVKDQDTPNTDLKVEISSNLDGKLVDTHPDASDNVKFETSSLSRGKHIITITATDNDKYSTTKTIEVSTMAPGNLVLESATSNSGSVQLQWQKYSMSDFKRYEIIRTTDPNIEGKVIASFNSVDSINYIDKLPPFASEIYYYVRISNTEDQSRNSNKIKVVEPAGKIYYYSATDAVLHPTEPIIYIVDNASQKIRAINYITQTEVNSTSLEGTVGKIDIGDNGFGLEIYVPNNNGFIKVYNASTLNLVTSINTGLATKCVITNGHGYVVASLTPSPWWEQPVRTYSRSTGINISGNTGTVFEANILRFIPNTDNIISISTSVSPVDMDFFQLNNTGSIIANNDDSYHGDHPLDPNIFEISSNSEFLITGNVGAVYSASNTMIYKGVIDRGALYFSDFAFSKDGNTIYAGTSNRTSLQIVKYPELTRKDEILTKGYPKFLFYRNGEIISLSLINLNSDNFAIERIKI